MVAAGGIFQLIIPNIYDSILECDFGEPPKKSNKNKKSFGHNKEINVVVKQMMEKSARDKKGKENWENLVNKPKITI